MKVKGKLLYAIAGAALLPSVLSAQDTTCEVRNIAGSATPRHINVKKAPVNASYETTLVGFLYYADSWNDLEGTTPLGIYTIGSQPGSQPEPFARIGVMNSHCNGGAVLAGDKYWYVWRQTDPSGSSDIDISQLYSYDIVTGEFQSYGVVDSTLASNADKSWDPVEDKIYGQYTVNNSRKLCVVDFEQQSVTPVGDCYTYYGLAFDNTGQLWGIDAAGDLYKVDKRNGSGVKVGSTGVVPKYSQSMAFDLKTNELYWASYTDAGKASSNLYKVDTSNAQLTLVTAFSDQEEFLGLGVMSAVAADNAPGYATGLSVTMNGSKATGSISFTLPQYTYMGNDLNGQIGYKVFANNNLLFEGSGTKGMNITRDITLPTGDVTVSVVCSNEEGDGPAALIQQWVGDDYPLAPENVRLVVDEASGKFSLTWDAVTEGVHGGYINPDKMSYTVTRFPDQQKVAEQLKATAFEESLSQPELPTAYCYEVNAVHDWRVSPEAAQSNTVPYGKGFEVPYFNNFDDAASLDLFYKIDGNGDGSTWKWSRFSTKTAYIFTGTDYTKPQDDWLLTPAIDMKAGNRYEVTYTITENMNNGKFIDMLETAFGIGVDPSTYTVVEETFPCLIGKAEVRKVVIEPKEDGYYHFGFHAVSDCIKGLSINIDNLNIDVLANEGAPSAVTGLTAKASQGTAPVSIRFTTPTKDTKGKKLEAITKVEVFRNTSELVKSVEMTETGKQITVVDNKGARGMTKYTVVAYNEHGVGERADIEIFLGLDHPGAPQDIALTDEGNGQLKLSWKAPKDGAHGGYCDPNNLTYNIYTLNNGYYADFRSGVRQTDVLITAENYYGSQQNLVVFAIAAQNSVGEGLTYPSTEVIVGNPYKYPFNESWVGGNERYDMWYVMNSGKQGWLPVANYSSDSDNGCISFDAAQDNDMSYFCLGKVDMSKASNPKLIFDYYAEPGTDMSIIPEINLAFTGAYQTMAALNFKTIGGEAGWREAVVDLSDCKTLPYISVRFLGVGSASHSLRIDNVRIMDSDKTPNLSTNGIGDIIIDNNSALYYDINGLPVINPSKGSIIIKRNADGKTSKVVF